MVSSAERFDQISVALKNEPKRWLVTGAAGFIGSHLVECLLQLGQDVVGFDNFATGYSANIEDVMDRVGSENAERFTFIEESIVDSSACARACDGVDYVLHQAAIGSVPRSIDDPWRSHEANVDGFIQMLLAARNAQVSRFVYASSSSVYGDAPELPKVENRVGEPLSPYATTKKINELYAANFARVYQMKVVGLRYFNVFGPRQDPNGAYAAVIPKWIALLQNGKECQIFGDGETSRDFCYIYNVVQANILAACTDCSEDISSIYNVAVGDKTSLNELYAAIVHELSVHHGVQCPETPSYLDFRSGDVRHSLADISKINKKLGYQPTHVLGEGIRKTVDWFVEHSNMVVE